MVAYVPNWVDLDSLSRKIDYAKLGGKAGYLPQAAHECGVGAGSYNFNLGWDTRAVKGTPTGWADSRSSGG